MKTLQEQEIDALRHEVFHTNAYIEQLHSWLKSDSVFHILSDAKFRPHYNGMFDIEDKSFIDLYELSNQLREADIQANDSATDNFHQQLP